MMDFCINDQNLCQNEEFCIQNEEFCIQNEEFCIQNEEFCSLDLSGNSLVKPAEGQFFIEYIYKSTNEAILQSNMKTLRSKIETEVCF